MLVTAAMLWFVEIGQMPAWMLLIVICREFAVSGLRIASDKDGSSPPDGPARSRLPPLWCAWC